LVALPLDESVYAGVERIQILACGTSRHAAQVGAYLLEQLAGIPTSVYYASEFRYAPPPLAAHTLTIGVTQSGETADTLAALAMEQDRRLAHGDPAFAPCLLGITNRPESSLARLVPHLLDIGAGPGTVMWAAADIWPTLEAATLVETSPAIRALGEKLAAASTIPRIAWHEGDLRSDLTGEQHDLVTLAYVLDELARFVGSDLLCYRAEAPRELVERQNATWNPWLDWAHKELGLHLRVASGIVHVEQDQAAIEAMRQAMGALDSFAIAALHPAADARYTCWCQYTNERYRYLKRLLLLP
jgi:hypothetical protein